MGSDRGEQTTRAAKVARNTGINGMIPFRATGDVERLAAAGAGKSTGNPEKCAPHSPSTPNPRLSLSLPARGWRMLTSYATWWPFPGCLHPGSQGLRTLRQESFRDLLLARQSPSGRPPALL